MKRAIKSIRAIDWMAAFLAGVIALTVPALFFTSEYKFHIASIDVEARFSATLVAKLINHNPDSWQFEETRLVALLEKRVQKRTVQLQASNEELQAFSYSVSHDLRTMAQTILNGCQEREPGRVAQLHIQPGLVAQGDPQLLRQVVENLPGNAWKFCRQPTPTLIAFGRESGPDGEAVSAVQDNGAGFDMAYSDKLFGALQRLHTMAEFTGSGIGLATVQRIIARHGGRVWGESSPRHGATFRFTLGTPTA